ncbi:HepT-like ribonuclease domain-containing protein [Coleofasciculus sp. G2-EDA-02]|uniref:HepT-like ribonuclease domain-containing protein n=1 Tax=Coleofasciculus sp. G2-EDA-02 TaxID=3069529 RepID=UPI0032F3AFE9
MTKRELDDFLQDILEAIGAVERFLSGVNFEEFAQNEEKIFAVEKAMEIIGEAVKNLPDSLRSQYPEIPWKNIAGMRDKLVHEYWGTDVNILWRTVQQRVPELLHDFIAMALLCGECEKDMKHCWSKGFIG